MSSPHVCLLTPEVLQQHCRKEFSRPVWKHTHSCRGWINPAGCSELSSFHADSWSCCRSSSPPGPSLCPSLEKKPKKTQKKTTVVYVLPDEKILTRPGRWTFDQVRVCVCVYRRGGSALTLVFPQPTLYTGSRDWREGHLTSSYLIIPAKCHRYRL